MNELKYIDPASAAKVTAISYGWVGLIGGVLVTLYSLAVGRGGSYGMAGPLAVLLMPLFNGIVGFISGFLGAYFYNLAASWVGGVQFNMERTYIPPEGGSRFLVPPEENPASQQ